MAEPAANNDCERFLASLPDAYAPEFNEPRALALAALPLSCIDRPQAKPFVNDYLYDFGSALCIIDDYERRRAFYGCYDWHSAVHSIWTLVTILRLFPQIPISGLIREKINHHLTDQTIQGELEFFQHAGDFEVPYGRSWLLKLYAALLSWDDPDARGWSQYLSTLAARFAATLSQFVTSLRIANRTGAHANSAYSLSLLLDYAVEADDSEFRSAIETVARRLFGSDTAGPVRYEPAGPDFLSPCLEEARLMSRVLHPDEFISWFDRFLPVPGSDALLSFTKPYDSHGIDGPDNQAAKSHLIGLSFSRAEAMLEIAGRLPAGDLRVPVYNRLAAIHGKDGWANLFSAGYMGSHWLATFALRYEVAKLRGDLKSTGV